MIIAICLCYYLLESLRRIGLDHWLAARMLVDLIITVTHARVEIRLATCTYFWLIIPYVFIASLVAHFTLCFETLPAIQPLFLSSRILHFVNSLCVLNPEQTN